MATTFVEYTGDGSNGKQFSFPSIQESDIKVEVDKVIKTTSTHYTISNYTTTGGGQIDFTSGNIPAAGTAIRIFRDTDVDTAKATYTAGSAIKSGDLNNNHNQLLYALQEEQNQPSQTRNINVKAVTTAVLDDDSVTGAKIADDSIDSEHYVDGSIDTQHIANSQITTVKIANDAINGTKIADDSIDSEHYVDGSIDTAHIADSQITTAKIADASVTAAKLASGTIVASNIATGTITATPIATNAVTTVKIADANVTTAKIADNAITTGKIADDAVTDAKLANSINSAISANTAKVTNATHTGEVTGATALTIANNAVVTARIADDAVTTAKIPDNAITTAKIADAELTTLASMQSGTASILASSTALTSTTAELNLLDGKSVSTTVGGSSTDNQLPTAKAVNDQILAITQAAGGFYPIANEVSFPNANPDPGDDAGTIVSIADAGGVVVNGSGVSTTGRTLGGATVTINGIDSSLYNTTIAAGKGMLVQTTSTLNTYTYHRLVVDEAGVSQAQTAVNSFNERYRVGSSNPSSSLDDGDLFFNTTSNKMLVYNATGSSWDEVQSVGNFFINTISSYSGTGGNSASFNGSAYRFVLSNAGTYAEQHIVSVNGVIQKPNSGTSQPSEGFAIDGSSIIFSAAPASGADYFIITIGAAVNIGAPSDNTVSTIKIQNAAVTNAKIADDTISEAKLDIHAAPSGTDKFLKYTSNGMEWVVPSYTTNQLTTEQVQDIVGAMFTGNTETNITATYEDSDGTIDLVSTDTNTQLSTEQVQDIVGAMFTGNTETNISVTYEDSDGTIDLVSTDTVYTHPNHSGEVTSTADGATVIADNVVDEANLKVSNAPTNGYVLTAQSGNTGGMTWEQATAGATGGNSNANAVFWENQQTVTHDYTIQNNYNAGSFGPITINSGITVTVGAGESWTVI